MKYENLRYRFIEIKWIMMQRVHSFTLTNPSGKRNESSALKLLTDSQNNYIFQVRQWIFNIISVQKSRDIYNQSFELKAKVTDDGKASYNWYSFGLCEIQAR